MLDGALFPQTEIDSDSTIIKDYNQEIEELSLKHILSFNHELGDNTANYDLKGRYKHTDMFHELFVLYGFFGGSGGEYRFLL